MSKGDISAVERIIASTINETAHGDPDALAARIVAALAAAGYCIVPANGIEDTALGPQPFDELTLHPAADVASDDIALREAGAALDRFQRPTECPVDASVCNGPSAPRRRNPWPGAA